MTRTRLRRLLRVLLMLYVPIVNIIYIAILTYSENLYLTLTHQTYFLYLCGIPIFFVLSRFLNLCKYHRGGLINPLVAPILIWVTPISWDETIRKWAIVLTVMVLIILMVRFFTNGYRHLRLEDEEKLREEN